MKSRIKNSLLWKIHYPSHAHKEACPNREKPNIGEKSDWIVREIVQSDSTIMYLLRHLDGHSTRYCNEEEMRSLLTEQGVRPYRLASLMESEYFGAPLLPGQKLGRKGIHLIFAAS